MSAWRLTSNELCVKLRVVPSAENERGRRHLQRSAVAERPKAMILQELILQELMG
jgi:hypothetical protein